MNRERFNIQPEIVPDAARAQANAGKLDWIVRHCVHAIATGRWPPGYRLPSVREAEARWGVGRLTVLKAYQMLVERELARSEARSGFFVAAGPRVERVSRHRAELDRLFEAVRDQIQDQTGLSTVGALEYLADMARARAGEQPECAFVECTRFHAQMHAREVTDRLGVACMALTTDELDGNRQRVPRHVRTLLTTGFHRAEVTALADPPRLNVTEVPISVSRALAEELGGTRDPLFTLGPDFVVRQEDADDLNRLLEGKREGAKVSMVLPQNVPAALEIMFREGVSPEPLVLLSPTLWEAAGEWREHERVMAMRYEIQRESWGVVADAIGLPLGALR